MREETLDEFKVLFEDGVFTERHFNYFVSLYKLGRASHIDITSNIDKFKYIDSSKYDNVRNCLITAGLIEMSGSVKSLVSDAIFPVYKIQENYKGPQVRDDLPTNSEILKVIEVVKKMNDFQKMRVRQWL